MWRKLGQSLRTVIQKRFVRHFNNTGLRANKGSAQPRTETAATKKLEDYLGIALINKTRNTKLKELQQGTCLSSSFHMTQSKPLHTRNVPRRASMGNFIFFFFFLKEIFFSFSVDLRDWSLIAGKGGGLQNGRGGT